MDNSREIITTAVTNTEEKTMGLFQRSAHPRRRMRGAQALLIVLFAGFLLLPGCGKEEQKSASHDMYLYQGSDRNQKLIANAKKEGNLTAYMSMVLKDSGPLIAAFEKKYGIKVASWRAAAGKVAQRAITEARANRYEMDVVEITGPQMESLYRENVLAEFYSPAFKDLPPQVFPKHRHYVADRFNFYVMAYNTKLVKPNEVPNSYEDLLDPKWHGKLGMERASVEWFAAVAKDMGEEKGLAYFNKLAELKPLIYTGHHFIAENVANGEVPIALNIFNHAAENLKRKGANIAWKALSPTFGEEGAIGVALHAPHPHAALLFADFILSREGQEIIKERGRVPASLVVDTPLNKFQYQVMDPTVILDEWDKWDKLWSGLFLGGEVLKKAE
jgi:iron(III) transport system substrate-binding protein